MAFSLFRNEEKKYFMSPIYYSSYSRVFEHEKPNKTSFECLHCDVPFDHFPMIEDTKNGSMDNQKIFKSIISFEIAKNVASSGSIDGLKYDFMRKCVKCSHVGGVLFAVLFDFYVRHGFEKEIALKETIKEQLQCVNVSLWGLAKGYVGQSLKNDETLNLCSVAIGKAFSGSKRPKLSIDYYQSVMFDDKSIGQIGKQFAVIMANSASETSGRKLGSIIGSTIGSIVPIVGSKIGDTVGGAVGSYGGSKLSSVLSDSLLTSPEEKIKMWLKNSIINTSYAYALSRDEMAQLLALMDEYLLKNKSISTSQDIQIKIEEQIQKTSAQITKRRSKVTLPSKEAYLDVLSLIQSKNT